MGSKVKGSESKSNTSYHGAIHGAINSGLLKSQKVWPHNFFILPPLVTNVISGNFKPKFSSLAAFHCTTPRFTKKKLDFLMQNLMLNQLVLIYFKSQELKPKMLLCPFLIAFFHFDTILIKIIVFA